MWSNTTFHFTKRLYTNNEEEYVTLELQSFLREQEIIHETNALHIYQKNGCTEQLNYILLKIYSQCDLKQVYQISGRNLLLQLQFIYTIAHLLSISNKKYIRRFSWIIKLVPCSELMIFIRIIVIALYTIHKKITYQTK